MLPAPLRLLLAAQVLAGAIALSGGAPAEAAVPPREALSRKLDPALAAWAAGGGGARTLWVEFTDKAPGGPADLAARLARAEASLAPRARARRLRARVLPLVDDRDVPVAPEYLASLEALGLRPFAVSRWLNHAAVRVVPAQLEALARLAHVATLSPVTLRAGARSPRGSPARSRARPRPPRAPAARPGPPCSGGRTRG